MDGIEQPAVPTNKPQPFFLGMFEGFNFVMKESPVSAVKNLDQHSTHLVRHLIVVDEDEGMTWGSFYGVGLTAGGLIDMAHCQMEGIVKHYLPGLTFADAAWRFEVDSPPSPQGTALIHLIITHRNLFGPDGPIRECTDDIRKPVLIVEGAMRVIGLWDSFKELAIHALKK